MNVSFWPEPAACRVIDSGAGDDPKRTLALTENQVMRFGILLATMTMTLMLSPTYAGDAKYIMNFDVEVLRWDGRNDGSIQLQGVHLTLDQPFHGRDFGEHEYFFTVSDVKDGKGRLTIEFYEYESRKKVSKVISEIVAEVDFELGIPAVFEGKSDTFGVDLAFSIDQE